MKKDNQVPCRKKLSLENVIHKNWEAKKAGKL
jgi:hypothetical protein